MGAIEEFASAAAFCGDVAADPEWLGDLPDDRRLALEIAVNETNERELLALELRELERRWRGEEEIAAIVDRELTEAPSLRRLIARVRQSKAAWR